MKPCSVNCSAVSAKARTSSRRSGADYGCNTYIGRNFYANTDCIFLDVARIDIGDNVFCGPRVSLLTPYHPIDAQVRNEQLEGGKPISIGNDVWFGGNVTVCPGVTIGDDVVIGACSVVVKDIPSHCIAVGNPCRPIRAITDADHEQWQRKAREYRAWKRESKAGTNPGASPLLQ